MRNKLIYSNYDRETGLSTVTIRNKYGEFTGYAKLHEEDQNIESSFAGCRCAEIKALIKSTRAQIKEINIQIKILEDFEKELKHMKDYDPYSMETRRLRRKIYELKDKKAKLYAIISSAESMVKASSDSRLAFLKRVSEKKA